MKLKAFTLAELLIALAILGVIATFTIPKVLQANQDAKDIALTKEAAATISGAYDAYKMQNTVSGTFSASSLRSFINYVRSDSVTTLDGQFPPGSPTTSECSWGECLVLHNGGYLYVNSWNTFGIADSTHFVSFLFDPDGKRSNRSSVFLDLYPNGRIVTSDGTKDGDTYYAGGSPTVTYPWPTATWFRWN